jgi:hypothetical protein
MAELRVCQMAFHDDREADGTRSGLRRENRALEEHAFD